MGGDKGGITAIALVHVIATILSVDGQFAQLDAGLAAGLRLGDVAEVYYELPAAGENQRVVVSRGRVVEVEELRSVLEVASEFTVLPGYSADFEIPHQRIDPLGIAELARWRMEQTSSDEFLRQFVAELIPENERIEREIVRVIQERWRSRSSYTTDLAVEEKLAPAVASDDQAAAMLAAVKAWAQAWADQRVDDYLAFYSREFEPPDGLGRAEWQELRRQRLTRPSFIKISLVFEESRSVGESWGWLRFQQSYWSNTFSDVVTKRLELVWEDGGWKILREIVES